MLILKDKKASKEGREHVTIPVEQKKVGHWDLKVVWQQR